MTLPIHYDHLKRERRLGLLPPTERCMAVRAGADRLPVIKPQSQWLECDWWTSIPSEDKAKLILDQGHFGSCTAFSCVGANTLQRYYRTGKIEIPSAPYLYDCINGGRDGGSVITDAKDQMRIGIPDRTAYPADPQFRTPPKPSGRTYTEGDSLLIDSPEEAATALFNHGGFVQAGICVDNNFETWKNGIAWGGRVPRGPMNHSIYLAGLKRIGGQWCFRMVNSWNLWGPFGDGTCWIPVEAIQPGGWVHISTKESDDTP